MASATTAPGPLSGSWVVRITGGSRALPVHDRLPFLLVLLASLLSFATPTQTQAAEDPIAFFEKRVRPVLIDHCYGCHSDQAEKIKGGLRLDSREGLLQGGDLGPALVPGDPDHSLLIRAVRFTDPDLQMPPKSGKLSDRQIADLAAWVMAGAPWPNASPQGPTPATRTLAGPTEADRNWWAFRPLESPPVPLNGNVAPGTYPIDSFVNAALQARGLHPNPPADRRDLIRRAYFDLIGLPPTPEEITAFENDPSPDAWLQLIDRLLARPQYGERWARHWLDVVRFAQSNGYERDAEKPLAWRYRDYVVRALNQDKPYNQFILEHIAGDELEAFSTDALIATGFQRLGVCDDEPDDKRMAEFDELDDILSTTASTFLGLTLGCARCHDHKFDPFPQSDYYRLLAFFRNLRLNEPPRYTLDSANYLPLADPAKVQDWKTLQETRLRRLQEDLAVATDELDRKLLTTRLTEVQAEPAPWDWALGVRERGPVPPPTHLLVRGNAATPGREVHPGFPEVLTRPDAPPPSDPSPRRLALAGWIASADNPLTARVLVNRVWQHHFGRGIVASTSDFGRAGSPPTHPELLDWLAADIIAHGWSIKHLHRTILLSAAYQRSSRTDNPDALAADPANTLLWRQNLRRLEAEALRDTLLAVSGQLNLAMGGRGFFPRLNGEVLAGQSRPGLDWALSTPSEQARRSLYTFIRRTMMVPILETFDYNTTSSPLGERPITTVAPQSLLLLNDAFLQDQANAFAHRLVLEAGPAPEHQVRRGFQRALGRSPSDAELRIALEFLQRQRPVFDRLQGRLTFRPDVPVSLSVDYMQKLGPEQFLIGPRHGWSYHRGRWSGVYEGIRTLDRDRSPFALWTRSVMSNGVVEARVIPHVALESGGVLFRATSQEDSLQGYECVIDPREQRLRLRRHDTNLVTLAETPFAIPEGQELSLRIEATEDHLRVWAANHPQPVIEVRDPNPFPPGGHVGIRAWGAALSVDDLTLQSTDRPAETIRDPEQPAPERRALQALCLMLLNLNETVYIP